MSYRDFLFQGLMNRGLVFDGDDGGGGSGGGDGDGSAGGDEGDAGGGDAGKGGKGKKADDSDDDDSDDDDSDDKPITLKEARRLRRENKERRLREDNSAKEIADLKKGDAEFKKNLAKALGIEDDEDDPEKLKKALDEEKTAREKRDDDLRSRDIRDSVRDACDEKDGNFKLVWKYVKDDLIASKVDPTTDGFDAQVSKTVQSALKEEPNLKKGKTPGKSGSDLGGGRPSDGKPKTLEDAVGAHYSDK